MDAAVRRALEVDRTVDLTTTGRRSGLPRRIEIWLLHQDGRFFVTGTPRPRDWLANVRAAPDVIVHLKQTVVADIPCRTVETTDPAERRRVLEHPSAAWYRERVPLDELVARSPMIELFPLIR